MAFQYVMLSPEQSAQFRPQLKGPVLGFAQSSAIDQQAGAVLLDLGGKPSLDPARGEPPGHYNLLWAGETVSAAGHFSTVKKDDGYARLVSLDISVPKALADKVDQIKQLIQDGMLALFNSVPGRIDSVEVSVDHVRYC